MLAQPRGRISTFYSYKGGTGRTMALANVAWILASQGKRVLAIDWDLEAPGLHRYFAPLLGDAKLTASAGLIDFLFEYWIAATRPDEDGDPRWFERYTDLAGLALPVLADFPGGGRLDVIGAGRQDGGYAERVTGFDWRAFYAEFGGAGFLDLTFDLLRDEYDYVLIDSRTGVSDTAGICTVQLPDSLVVFFTLNNQSIEGASAIAHDALEQRRASERGRLAVFPVPSRVDLFERDKLEIRRSLVRERFTDLLDLDAEARKRYFSEIELLYVPFYSYEEQLATIVDRPNQHASLLGSLERLTGHVSRGEVRQLLTMSDALRADFRAKYDAFHRGETTVVGGDADERWDIFLSYDFGDRASAAALYRLLQPRFKTFYDVEAIAVGQNMVETVARAMSNSRIAVILISRAALSSSTLAREVDTLLDGEEPGRKGARTKRVLPVLIGVEPHELPEGLSRLRAYRALSVPADEQAASAAAAAILSTLGETPEPTAPQRAETHVGNHVGNLGNMSAGAGSFRALDDAARALQSTNDAGERPGAAAPQREVRWWPPLATAIGLSALAAATVLWVMPRPSHIARQIDDRGILEIKLELQAEALREAEDATHQERGLRATQLAEDHDRVIEALVLGVQAVGAYDTTRVTPPASTSTGLLAALTRVGGDATLRHTLAGHRNGVSTLLYAGSGSAIASVDGAGVVRIWDTSTGKLTATLNQYGSPPGRVALADDGSQIAWSSAEGVVHVWRVSATEEYASFGPFGGAYVESIRDLAFWDEGGSLAIATSRGVYVYDLASKTELSQASKGLGANQIALASRSHHFAADGAAGVEVFELGSLAAKKKLWPTRLAKLPAPAGLSALQVLPGGEQVLMATPTLVEIHDVAYPGTPVRLESSLGSRALIAGAGAAPVVAVAWPDDPIVRIWSAALGPRDLRANEGIAGLALANDGSRLALLDRGGAIQIWQLDSLRRLTTIAGEGEVGTMSFGPDGERLVTGSSEGSARVWNLRQRKTWDLGDPGQPIRDLDLVAGLLATANDDRITRVWDLQLGRELLQLSTTKTTVTALALVRGQAGRRGAIVTAGREGPTRLVDLDDQTITELADAATNVLALAVSPDGNTIAGGDPRGVVHVWNREGEPLATLTGPAAGVEALAFSSDGKRLASGQDRTIVVWELATRTELRRFEGHLSSVKSLAFSPDGTWIASTSGDKVARLWTLDGSESRTLEGHLAPLTKLAFSPDGSRLVTASEDSTAGVWALATGTLELALRGHASAIRSVAFSPDGASIVTASDDASARIWRSDDGTLIASLIGHRTGLIAAMISEDGQLLITASSDGDLRLWPTTPSDWLRAGCEELFERAEYGQVSAICQPLEGARRSIEPTNQGATVLQLDPTIEQTPAKTIIKGVDPTGKEWRRPAHGYGTKSGGSP
ncbi:KGGVGR-motif variant AAA ATPase [Nannocystaceae bacterium ST9]